MNSDDGRPKWTFIFIIFCTFVFFLELFFPLANYFSFVPSLAFKNPWTFITAIFLHADFSHLFFNMFALFIFGIYLEARISRKYFLFIFFSAGFLGNVAYLLTSPYGTIPAVGASGAIYGIIGALAILHPTLLVYFFYMPMPMIVLAFLWGISSVLGMFTPSNIAHQSHLAGLIIGVLIGLRLRKKKELIHTLYVS